MVSFLLSIKFDSCLGLRVLINISYENVPRWIREIPGHLKTQEMCDEAVGIEPRSLAFVPDHFKTEGMCNEAVGRNAYTLDNVPDYIMTQKICNEAMHENTAAFFVIPDHFKTQKKCIKAFQVDQWHLNVSLTVLKHKKCVVRP